MYIVPLFSFPYILFNNFNSPLYTQCLLPTFSALPQRSPTPLLCSLPTIVTDKSQDELTLPFSTFPL